MSGPQQQPWAALAQQWAGQLGQLAQLGGWARDALDAVAAPHAAHGDPAQHPDCPLCRAIAVVQAAIGEAGPRVPEPEIAWVPVTRTHP